VVFVGFLQSPQGQSLAADYSVAPADQWLVRLAVVIVLFHTVSACWFATIVSLPEMEAQTATSPASSLFSRWHNLPIFVWTYSFAIIPLLAFAVATRSAVVISTLLASAAVFLVVATLTLRTTPGRDSLWRRAIDASIRHRHILALIVALIAILPLLAGAYLSTTSPLTLSRCGPILIALIGISSSAALAHTIFVLIPHVINAWWAGWLVLGALLVRGVLSPVDIDRDNPLLREQRIAATVSEEVWQSRCAEQSESVEEELRVRRVQNSAAGPKAGSGFGRLGFVSAEGGGIRAAYWTAMALAHMDRNQGAEFGGHVVLLSGVSGGSLGIATFLAGREVPKASPERRIALISDFLRSDFLSPLIGGLFFLDIPRMVFGPAWPAGRRDQVFERVLYDRWLQLTGSDFFARPLRRLCFMQVERAPQLAFMATDVVTGKPVMLSNTNFHRPNEFHPLFRNALDHTSLRWITVAQAVSISARFPFLAPGAEVGITADQVTIPAMDFADYDYASQKRAEGKELIMPSQPTSRQNDQDTAVSEEEAAAEELVAQSVNAVNHFHRMARSQQAELDRRAEWPEDPSDVVRIGTLVDGGYFDNSALTPVIAAVEAMHSAADPKDRGATYYRVFHFENDPANVCNAVIAYDPKALKFLQRARAEIKCDWEMANIKASLARRPFQLLTIPFEAIFSVRSSHAAQQKAALEKAHARGKSPENTMEIVSLSREMDDLRNGEYLYNDAPPFGYYLREKDILDQDRKFQEMIDLLQRKMGKDFDDGPYRQYVADWRSVASIMASRWDCHPPRMENRPPLGWMLAEPDRQLIECLAARGAVRAILDDLETPWEYQD
jgi:hypothetical protein